MTNKKTSVPFKDTAEQERALLKVIEDNIGEPGALLPIMQQAQDIYGYLPIEVQTIIAKQLEIPIEEVYSTATFYAQFALNPKGKHQISVCLGTACYVKGAGEVLERFEQNLGIKSGGCTADGLFSLDACRCIGACGLAPVIMIGEDVHARLEPGDADPIIEKYRNDG